MACKGRFLAGIGAALLVACGSVRGAETADAPMLRLARSNDGSTFMDAGLFAEHSASPAILAVPNGPVLAAFNAVSSRPSILVSRSRDNGRTWLAAQPVVLGEAGARLQPSNPALVAGPLGTVRMYFYSRDDRSAGRGQGFVGAAVTRDGLHYEWDRRVRIPCREPGDVRPVAVRLGRSIHLYLTPVKAPVERREPVRHMVSGDGRVFREFHEALDVPRVESLVDAGGGLIRLFAGTEGGITAYSSRDLTSWQKEGVCIDHGASPTVARTAEGDYLMVYAVTPGARFGTSEPSLVSRSQSVTGEPSSADEPQPTGWDALAFGAEQAPSDAVAANGGDAIAVAVDNAAMATAFAPAPDWDQPVDYLAWLNEQIVLPTEGNAYDAYAGFLAMPDDPPGAKPWWPDTIDSMFNGEYKGDPYPWDPATHPQWEAAAQSTANLLEWFREAARLEQYVMPLGFTERQIAEAPGGRPMLYEILLPGLAQHRALVKLAMDDAWRAEGGQLVPERMIGNVETSLRGASHLLQGPTLIHHLVGVAEQSMARDSIRQALGHGAWTAEQLQAGLDVLRGYDRPPDQPDGWLGGETAMGLDVIQRLFVKNADGKMLVNDTVAKQLVSATSGQSGSDTLNLWSLRLMKPEDGVKTAQAYREFAKQFDTLWRTGYPQVRAADLEKLTKKYHSVSPITRLLLPDLSRAYKLMARNEASRQATQLTYSVHLFHAANGRWPATLDELPEECATMRKDPFTGGDFNYRLTPAGPTIYSSSENAIDDGGVHAARWDDSDSAKQGGSDDYVFWPVQPKQK